MASTVLEVGTGVFVIAIIWVAVAVTGMILLRASGSAKCMLCSSSTEMVEMETDSLKNMLPQLEALNTFEYFSPKLRLGIIPIFLLALIITFVLVFFPRSPETPPPFKEVEIVDTLFIGRYILLVVVSAVFLVMFFMLLPFHFLEPVYAKALRTH